jgi:hypothetical protein
MFSFNGRILHRIHRNGTSGKGASYEKINPATPVALHAVSNLWMPCWRHMLIFRKTRSK